MYAASRKFNSFFAAGNVNGAVRAYIDIIQIQGNLIAMRDRELSMMLDVLRERFEGRSV